MEIIGTDYSEKEIKNNKLMKIILILVIITVVAIVGLFGYMYYLKENTISFTVDGVEVSEHAEDLFLSYNDKVYVSIKDMAKLVKFNVYNGEYNKYQEDDLTRCYVENDYEATTFELDSNIIYKTSVVTSNNGYEYFEVDGPVVKLNNKLYATVEGISKACNIIIDFNKKGTAIQTLEKTTEIFKTAYADGDLTVYNNQKALLYDRIVRGTYDEATDTAKYGVYTLDGKEIIGARYYDIEFMEGSKEFKVTTQDKKKGIVTIDGMTKINPQYDNLKLIDANLELYLVEKNNKKGVVDKNDQTLIYIEFDEIGVDASSFTANGVKNPYLLFNNCIPVSRDGKWGIIDKNGKTIVPVEYDDLGCKDAMSYKNNVLIIPDVKCIVGCKIYGEKKYYNIFNYLGKEVIPMALTTVYSTTSSGREDFTMISSDYEYNVVQYIRTYVKIDELNRES